ncbi:MAG TPA: hypothetical protein VIG33_05150 [Pseudobdellovibrionaceae bacterium]|jgi:hypothetical protein
MQASFELRNSMKLTNSILKTLYSFCFLFLVTVAANAQCPQQLQSDTLSTESFLRDLRKHIDTENENTIPYYVLGLDEGLTAFYNKVKEDTHHQTLYYDTLYEFSLSDHPLKSKLLKEVKLQKKYHSVEEWMPVFEKTMQNWVVAAPNRKTIYFNLDRFDFKKYQQFSSQIQDTIGEKKASSKWTNFTNAEMKFILSDKKIFNKIRWFVNNRELTSSEIKRTFKDVAPQLF